MLRSYDLRDFAVLHFMGHDNGVRADDSNGFCIDDARSVVGKYSEQVARGEAA
jgi:hypothetical protein